MNYKLLKDCHQGDWVYYDAGKLYMVDKKEGSDYFTLIDGFGRLVTSDDTRVYPLTPHNKVIAEGIYSYYKEMCAKGLINGSRWTNWLNDKMSELMELDENASREECKEIWDSIEEQIKDLEYHAKEMEYHKSFLA